MGGPRKKRVEIGLEEFIRLAFFNLACHDSEFEIGDSGLDEPMPKLIADIQKNSFISLTLEQLESLVFHYKQAILYRFSLKDALKLTPDEYQSMLRKIQSYIPEYMRRNKYGELEICGMSKEQEKIKLEHSETYVPQLHKDSI